VRPSRLGVSSLVIAATLTSSVAIGAALTPSTAADSGSTATRAAVARAVEVACVGTETSCRATVKLTGGASNKRVVIALPSTGMRLESVRPTSSDLKGAYLISGQARTAARRYAFTLNAARAPRGSAIVLRFRTPRNTTPRIIRCNGGATQCIAKLPLRGGAAHRKVVVQLPATDLGLVSVKPSTPTLRGAYSLTDQRLRAGHSEYQFVLDAVAGAPAGSFLRLAFATY